MALSVSRAGFSVSLSAWPLHESASGYLMDLRAASRGDFVIEIVAGPSSRTPFSTRKGVRTVIVNCVKKCISRAGTRQLSKDIGGTGCLKISSKLSRGVRQSHLSKLELSRRPTGRIYSALVTEIENVDEFTETKEGLAVDASRKPRMESSNLNKAKLISVQDYMEQAPNFLRMKSGPPRWFCSVDAKGYPRDAPLLLFLPGMDSTGLGLLLHQKTLARLFEVQCLHVPVDDRTPFVGLLEVVEQRIREEVDRRPGPIYIIGESFGGSLALAVGARNPSIDIVLVIVNPATSFEKSPMQPFLPLLQIIPNEVFRIAPYLLSFTMGDPVKMASASVDSNLRPWERIPKVADALTALLPTLPVLADIMPKETLIWKVKLISAGARYTNSRIRGVKGDVLILASGMDKMLPSASEARRLKRLLPQSRIRFFPNSGHTLLLEEGVDVASLIKSTQLLRHKKKSKFDPVTDFRPPFPDEVEKVRNATMRIVRQLFSPVFLNVTEDGRVQRGLPQLREGRPLLFVGNHTLIGFDLGIVVEEVLTRNTVLLRGLAHPLLSEDSEDLQEPGGSDLFRLFGSVPVTGANLYKLLARGESVLLYPGGVREALKRKGEAYKLFWSETAEFVRTAIRHGATIVPFASVGGDDIVEIVLDRNDLLSIPFLSDYIRESVRLIPAARTSGTGEVINEDFVLPVGYPKLPPRMYFMFKQPIPTEGMLDSINDRVATSELYCKVKGEVESGLEYLLHRRSKDPYKDFIPRVVYEATNDTSAPTFDF